MAGEGRRPGREQMLRQIHTDKEGSGGVREKGAEEIAPEHLHPQLQEIWKNVDELIDVPHKEDFGSEPGPRRDSLMNDYMAEIKKRARDMIKAAYAPDTEEELTPGLIDEIKGRLTESIKLLDKDRFVIELVTDRRKERNKDTLTGTYSLEGIKERFYLELERLKSLPDTKIGEHGEIAEVEKVMVLIEFDIDDFKAINDRLTHAGADEKIIELAQKIKATLKSTDAVGRRSGDEFTVILNDIDPEDLPGILQRMTAAASEIEVGGVDSEGRKREGTMGITGSARVITKAEAATISYKQANAEADNGATFQKIENKRKINIWSKEGTTPDLSTEPMRNRWARRKAESSINRLLEEHYSKLRKETDKEKRILRLSIIEKIQDEMLEVYVDVHLAEISIEHGDLEGEKEEREFIPERARTAEAREAYAKLLAEQEYDEQINKLVRIRDAQIDETRRAEDQDEIDGLERSKAARIKRELRNLEDQYSHLPDYEV